MTPQSSSYDDIVSALGFGFCSMTKSHASIGMTKLHTMGACTLVCALLLASCGGGGSKSNNNQNPPPGNPPPTVGLDVRPSNATCVAPARGAGGAQVDIVDAFPNLQGISQPVKVLVEPVANPRWFVLRKTGQLVVFDPDNANIPATFLDLSGPPLRTASEGGLLGMAFHPDYPGVPEIFPVLHDQRAGH